MKVYYNEPMGSCGYGCVLIAANSLQEAIETWHNDKEYDNAIDDQFEEFNGLSYDCEEPRVILNNWEYC